MRDINLIIDELRGYIDDPKQGLPLPLFNFITELTPMVNADLLIKNNDGQFLLAWRIDYSIEYGCIQGWHVPGGIVRVHESLHERLQKTALNEIGSKVTFKSEPINIEELIYPVKVRPHFYSFLYECFVPKDYDISKQANKAGEAGFLAWHDKFPNDMIPVHHKYKKFFTDKK